MSEAALTSVQTVRCRKEGDKGCGGRKEVLEKEERGAIGEGEGC